jgi:hypothetical protein
MRIKAERRQTILLVSANDPEQKSHQFEYLSGNFKGHRQDVPQ